MITSDSGSSVLPNLTTLVQIELTGLILRTIEGRMQQIKKMFSINKATHQKVFHFLFLVEEVTYQIYIFFFKFAIFYNKAAQL